MTKCGNNESKPKKHFIVTRVYVVIFLVGNVESKIYRKFAINIKSIC